MNGSTSAKVVVGRSAVSTNSPDYMAMNPTSRIPTIEDDGNLFTLWESHAIVRYLAQKHGSFRFLVAG